jgi:hypothetical protein
MPRADYLAPLSNSPRFRQERFEAGQGDVVTKDRTT